MTLSRRKPGRLVVAAAALFAGAAFGTCATVAAAQSFGSPGVLSNTVPGSDTADDRWPQVAGDGAGNWIAVWSSSENLAGAIGDDDDILVALSSDDGASWSAPRALNTNAGTDSGDDSGPRVATDGAGNWIVAWSTEDTLGGTIDTDGDVLFARSGDSGATWSAPEVLNTNASTDTGADRGPDLATDGAGNWIALWTSSDSLGGTIGTDDDILMARSSDHGMTWSAPAAVNTNAATDSGTDIGVRIATDGGGALVAAWTSTDDLGGTIGTDEDILVVRSSDGGSTWSAPQALNTNAATDSGRDFWPDVATDGAGGWVASWQSGETLGGTIGPDNDILVASSADDGASWSAPQPLNSNASTDSGGDTEPMLASDGAGVWVAVWSSNDSLGGVNGTESDILFARSTDAGASWSTVQSLNTNAASDTGFDHTPQVATDGAGGWIVLWGSRETFGGTLGDDDDILFSRSNDDGASWDAPQALNTNATAESGLDSVARVVTDGAGEWIAVWHSSDPLGGTIGEDYDILYARSIDDGATWSAPEPLNANAATDSGMDLFVEIATDGAGNWVAAWTSSETLGGTIGGDFDILFARSSDSGSTWSAPQALNGNAITDSGMDLLPVLAADGAGNWVAVWFSTDTFGGTLGGDEDVLVARSSDDGVTWSAPQPLDPVAAAGSGRDLWASLVTDGAGNWLAAWASEESLGGAIGTDADILFSRSTDDGASWSPAQALNTNAATDSGGDNEPALATDGEGNWVAIWSSSDTLGGTIGSDTDILVAVSTDDGVSWSAPQPLDAGAATDSGADVEPNLAFDGVGHWGASWSSTDSLGGTIGEDADILSALSIDDGATWSAPAALNTSAATDAGGDHRPRLDTDGDGHWVAVWDSEDDLGGLASLGATDVFFATGSVCGDAFVTGDENCDVGVDVAGDCCSGTCDFETLATPCGPDADLCTMDVCSASGSCGVGEPLDASSCLVAPATKLQIVDSADAARDKLGWQWSKGDAFAQVDLGAPQATTTYALCIYDTSASIPSLAASVVVEPSASLWSSKDPKGFQYKDKAASADGVTKAQMKTGAAASTSVKLSARGANLPLPAPAGATYFALSPRVVVQLRNSEGGCWTSEFTAADTSRNDGSTFKAKTK